MLEPEKIALILGALPDSPGVYQYFDENGEIIYIGKAKNIRKRVSSYFLKEQTGKSKVLVGKIVEIKPIVVNTEFDALLLENNLIKKYRPRYNVLLKDDKTYPWICIKNEPFPRVFATRKMEKDGSQYFGPYASVKMMNTILELVRKLFPLRNCSLNLSKAAIDKKKYKVCLEYYIKNCKGPCIGAQEEKEYINNIHQIKKILRGKVSEVIKEMKQWMMNYAAEMKFEQAHDLKEKIQLLEKYQSKSTVFSNNLKDVDVFSILSDDNTAYVNYFKVVDGAIILSHTVEMKLKIDEDLKDLLSFSVIDFRERFFSQSNEIVLPFAIDIDIPNVTISTPRQGEKKNLLDLSERNLKFYILEKQKRKDLIDPNRHANRILRQMQEDLQLKELPDYIECFDNSNIQGDYPVSAMTVFKNAKPSKLDYRHFNVRTVKGANDYATMAEVLNRRYTRLIEEKLPLPKLIVIDGGKGQLSVAVQVLNKLNLGDKIQIIAIAERLEEIYRPGDAYPIHINKKSETLKIIQQLRDEAHRFGIEHYRKRHEKGLIKSELTQIPGIGKQLMAKLLQQFHSVKGVKAASFDELKDVLGKIKAQAVWAYFHPELPVE